MCPCRTACVPQDYEERYFFWESIVMMRKLAVTAATVYFGAYAWELMLLACMGVIVVALLAQMTCR